MSEDNPGRPETSGQSCTGPAASKKNLPITYDHGRVHNGYLFATHRDRGFYIRANCDERWLNEHPDVWVPDPKANQETSSTRVRSETEPPVQEYAAEAPSDVSSPDIQKDGKRYVTANRYAEMLGISRRQLSRLDGQGKTSPKIKIGNKVFFEVS
jgi:hypothetical protein